MDVKETNDRKPDSKTGGQSETTSTSNVWVSRLMGWPGVVLAFFWGAAEASFFFISPDVILSFASLLGGKRALRHIISIVLGALTGGALIYSWAARDPEAVEANMVRISLANEQMFVKASEDYERLGAWAPAKGAIILRPFKIYASQAPKHVSLIAFVGAAIPARSERLIVIWALVGWIGFHVRKRRGWSFRIALGALISFWTLLYGYVVLFQ